jgi:uncharacterized protein involved in propanediol utilization
MVDTCGRVLQVILNEQKNVQLFPERENMGVGRAFGTFGELLQGCLLEDNTDFLVTFPIDCYSYAIFVLDPTLQDVCVFPPEKQKSQVLTRLILAHYGLPSGGRLILQSELPVGKGLASSSADLVAAAKAVSSYFHLQIESALLAQLMCQIEPSDGVMYPGATAFYHRRGVLHEFLGPLPALTIVGIDEGGEIDTIQFNCIPKLFSDAEKEEYQQLLIALSIAIRRQDSWTIGRVATRSAMLNQKLNPKRTLDEVMALCQEVQGLGVVAAHSGTCLGILLAADEPDYHDRMQQARTKLAHLGASVQIYHSFHGFGG